MTETATPDPISPDPERELPDVRPEPGDETPEVEPERKPGPTDPEPDSDADEGSAG